MKAITRDGREVPIAVLHERFDSRVVRGGDDGCWEWTGATNGSYGQFRVGAQVQFAHRFAYERWVGPIPDGLTIDHLCRTPLCVNPGHLEPVTSTENTRRKPRPTHCPKGHVIAEDCYTNAQGHRRCRPCALERSRQWWALNRAKGQAA